MVLYENQWVMKRQPTNDANQRRGLPHTLDLSCCASIIGSIGFL